MPLPYDTEDTRKFVIETPGTKRKESYRSGLKVPGEGIAYWRVTMGRLSRHSAKKMLSLWPKPVSLTLPASSRNWI